MTALLIASITLVFLNEEPTLHQRALKVVEQNAGVIRSAARQHGIPPRLLAAVVYAEQALNVKPGEALLEGVLARTGYNASLGPAQVKVETAEWLLTVDRCAGLSTIVQRKGGLVSALIDPETNLAFAACYVSMILEVWKMRFNSLSTSDVAIVGTLYSLGLIRSDGSLRSPHKDAKANEFGIEVGKSYGSTRLKELFPLLR